MAQVSFKSNVSAVPDWLALQMRIFTRWINQKLVVRNLQIKDILKDISGDILKNLVEILSEKPFPGKPLSTGAAAKMRVQQIDNAGRALKFAEDCGVVMELKCSAENLVDGTEKPVLGLVWAIMRTFMKFGNEQDSKMKASDALLGWVKNQVAGYKHAEVKDFQSSFKNGMVLCALLHKFRPKLVGDYDKLQPAQFEVNLKTAFKAAGAYFGLDEYLTPAEIQKLDDKSMVVYVSEYYAGIAAQRKLDVAARRIGKLIATTKHNDALRNEYNERAARLKANLKVAEGVLLDRTVDNNLAGAQKRLDDFYSYQTKEKSLIINDYLSIESLYNQLALKLADHKRPPFVPAAGLELPALRAAFLPLEKCEQERNIALHDEVHRQTELLVINGQHLAKYEKLAAWTAAKLKYLGEKEKVDSSGEAEYQLNRLDAYGREAKATREGTVAEMEALGKKLLDEKFEKAAEVAKREDDIRKAFAELDAAAVVKLNTLKDDLARNQLIEKIALEFTQHGVTFGTLKAWLEKEEKSLAKKEEVSSVRDARVFLDHIALYVRGRADLEDNLQAFAALGKAILAAKHESSFSQWVFPTPEEIRTRDTFIAEKLARLNDLVASKKATLEDDLARELFKDALLLKITQHTTEFKNISAYADEKKAYLSKKEQITTVKDARAALNLIDSVNKGKAAQLEGQVAQLKTLGADILASKYETKLSSFSTPDPEAVKKREADVDAAFTELDTLYAEKLKVLQDDLAREDFREKIELQNEQHEASYATLKAWIDEKEAYLKKKETCDSVRESQVQLNALSVYEKDKAALTAGHVKAFNKEGTAILEAKYSGLTQYSIPQPEAVKARLDFVEGKWKEFDALHADKLAILQDDLARNEFRDRVALNNDQHVTSHASLKLWVATQEVYVDKKEAIDSVQEARVALNSLDVFEKDKAEMRQVDVAAFKKLGKEILDAKYETKLSTYTWPARDEVTGREQWVDSKFDELTQKAAAKKAGLEASLANEIAKEKARVDYASLGNDAIRWARDAVETIGVRAFGFTLAQVETFGKTMAAADAEYAKNIADRKAKYTAVYEEGVKLGATNVQTKYISQTVAQLDEVLAGVTAAIAARVTAYEAELAVQRANDALCRDFAGKAVPFVAALQSAKDKLGASTAALEVQVKELEGHIAGAASGIGAPLGDIKAVSDKIAAAKVQSNPHTLLSYKDIDVQWNQYLDFLKRKKKQIEDEIQTKALRGVTPEQMQEIEKQFAQYDADGNKLLELAELKACLYSLGHDYAALDLKKIMVKFGGTEAAIDYAGFKNFMVSLYGDTDTKEEINNGFKLLNKGKASADPKAMELMADADLKYMMENAPKNADGTYDYSKFVDAMFSR